MRTDLEIITSWIQNNERVLDLGCGSGEFLKNLHTERNVYGIGLEKDLQKIQSCLEVGVNVINQDLDSGLKNFKSNSFDTVLLAQTLQALSQPDVLIEDMLRVGERGIVTFPNFGNWKSRLYLFFRGRMPISKFMPHNWYDTPNIHFCTVKDFDLMCVEKSIKVLNKTVVNLEHQGSLSMKLFPNFLGEIAIYQITRS